MVKILVMVMVALGVSFADEGRHSIGVGGSITSASTHTVSKDKMVDLTLKYNYSLFKWLDLEARGSFYVGYGNKLYHPVTLGAFIKPNVDVTDRLNFYGLAGYSKNTLSKSDSSQVNAVTIQDDFSYGAGAEFGILKYMNGFVDYVRYIDKSTTKPEGKYSIKIDAVTLGLNYKFGFEPKNKIVKVKEKVIERVYVKMAKQKVRRVEPSFSEFTTFDDMARGN